jgi:hypothetical protein
MVEPVDGPGSMLSPLLVFTTLIPSSIYVLFFANKKPFCCILHTVLDLVVTALQGKKRSSPDRLETAVCWLVVFCAALRTELTSRDVTLISGLIIISNILHFFPLAPVALTVTAVDSDAVVTASSTATATIDLVAAATIDSGPAVADDSYTMVAAGSGAGMTVTKTLDCV